MIRWSDHSAFSLRTRQRGDRTRQGSRLPAGCHDRRGGAADREAAERSTGVMQRLHDRPTDNDPASTARTTGS